MKTYLLIILCYICSIKVNAQIETKYFQKGDMKAEMHRLPIQKNAKINKIMSSFDLQKIQKEDAEMEGEDVPYRFGYGFDVNYTLADGEWEEVEDGRLWSLTIKSEGALSLNFVFDNFHLAEGAQLYIENQDRTVLYGSVTSDAIVDEKSTFLTDIIPGDISTIYLYEPNDHLGESTLTVSRVIHGYRGIYVDMNNGTVGASSGCNVDVACYPAYSEESNAIALVLLANGEELCSGSLLIDTGLTFDPYFLTAFHCIDDNKDDTLSDAEKNIATNWMFKFCFKKTACNGSSLATSYTYNKADFCAAWNSTDFALMKIKGPVSQNQNLTWLGWDRTGSTPTNGAGIHHPAGDAMKISIENNTFSTTSNLFGNEYWKVYYDVGIVQKGSSGSPLLNQNKRVVGQLRGGTPHNNLCLQKDAHYGKFNLSWTGGGTNATRLSNWLYPKSTGQTTTNSAHPINIEGNTVITTSNSYYIKNLPSGYTVSWALDDSYYNAHCLEQNKPATNQCVITRDNGRQMSHATLTATIKYNGTFVRDISLSGLNATGFTGTYFNGNTTKTINLPTPLYFPPNKSNVSITSPNLKGATVSVSGALASSTWSLNTSTGVFLFKSPSSTGTSSIHVDCADGSGYNLTIIVTNSSSLLNVVVGDGQLEVSLVPAEDGEGIQMADGIMATDAQQMMRSSQDIQTWTLEVYEATTGKKMFSQVMDGLSYSIDTTGWKSGVYIIKAIVGNEVLSEKVIIK